MHANISPTHWYLSCNSLLRLASRSAMVAGLLLGPGASVRADDLAPGTEVPASFAEDIADGVASAQREAREAAERDEPSTPGTESHEPLEPLSQPPEQDSEQATGSDPPDDDTNDQRDQVSGNARDQSVTIDDAAAFGAALSQAAREGDEPATNPDQLSTENQEMLEEVRAKVASFNGIQPGISTGEDVASEWGAAAEEFEIDGGSVLMYDTEPFRQIEVVVIDQVIDTVKIELKRKLSSRRLIEQLNLEEFEPADVHDEDGQLLGQVFPERGVLLMHDPEAGGAVTALNEIADVTHIVIQPLDPAAFTLRAENRLQGPYEQNIRDLKLAVALDPQMAHAHWLLAGVYLATGQAHQAEAAAKTAFQLDPDSDAFRLRWARALEMLANYDQAVHETRAVLDGPNCPQVVKAQALHQMGRLATLGGIEIRSKAIPFNSKAIDIADKLATSSDSKERRAAKQLLVDAHLSIAREVASQKYENKIDSISQWISRASGLAEDAIENDNGSLELRLAVAEAALATLADLKPTVDPTSWISEAQATADDLLDEYDDTLWRRRVQWQLGVAYFHAIRIEHTRRQTAMALKYGERAISNLAEGAKSREAVPDSEHLVGRLYFHIGAIHAVHEKDHEAAFVWYEKAMPLLTSPVPVTELAVPRRHGEALVSMGVTFWQQGQRTRALELTTTGADLIKQAVTSGVLEQEALAVPYGNLATMHKDLGNGEEGTRYSNLAQNAQAAGRASTPGRTSSNTNRQRVARNRGRRSPSGNPSQRRSPGNQVQRATSPSGNRSGGSQMNIHPELRGN